MDRTTQPELHRDCTQPGRRPRQITPRQPVVHPAVTGVYRAADRVREVSALRGAGLRALRRKLQMVFQNPYESLNPRMTVAEIVAEPLVCLEIGDRRDHRRQVAEVLERG